MRDDDDRGGVPVEWLMLLGMVTALLWMRACEQPAHGQDVGDAAVVARCLVAEADGNAPDFAPLLAVLRARAASGHTTVSALARRYCAALHVHRPDARQRAIRALPDGPGSEPWREAYAAALVLVDAPAGHPCGRARISQWAGWGDHPNPAWSQAYCGPQCPPPVHGRRVGWARGCVANRFYVEHGRVRR